MRTTGSASSTATRCAVYLRVSLDRTGEGLAVARQREDCQAIVAARGWAVHQEYTEKPISAYNRTKKRPEYDRMVADYRDGRFGAIVVWDLDRLTRQPGQLEEWITEAEDRGLLLVTANGEADLSTDGGRMYARIKAAVARAEMERKSARQKRAALQRAEQGKIPAGVRLTGYEIDGTVRPDEAELVRNLFRRFHAGESLRSLAAWLDETGAPSRTGRRWNSSTVRGMLTNERYAGRAVYSGKANGRPGRWEALVDEPTFGVVQNILNDPRRRRQQGTDRKHLGSSLYRCGVCGGKVYSHSGGRYRCPVGGHITRLSASIDQAVLRVLRQRLSMPDLAAALTPPDNPEAAAQAQQITHLRARLLQFESDYDAGLIDGHRYRVATDKVTAELSAAEAAQIRISAGAGVAATLASADPVAAFDAAPLTTQRAILSFLMTVTLHPARRGHKFDPNTVEIAWCA